MIDSVRLGLFFVELTLVYFISRLTISKLFFLVRRLFHSDSLSNSIVAFIFFPGTVIHELSHFIMATVLMLRVHDIHVFPERDGKTLKLGRVIYQKADPIRSILVGIAPLIIGILILWWLFTLQIFFSPSILIRVLGVLIVFILTTSMFSSKQDLVDVIYIIPVVILLVVLGYIFQINIFAYIHPSLIEAMNNFLYAITIYLGISLGIHVVLFAILSLLLIPRHK